MFYKHFFNLIQISVYHFTSLSIINEEQLDTISSAHLKIQSSCNYKTETFKVIYVYTKLRNGNWNKSILFKVTTRYWYNKELLSIQGFVISKISIQINQKITANKIK